MIKHQLLTNKRERTNLKYLTDYKAFIEYSNDMDDIYKNFEEQLKQEIQNINHFWWDDS